MILADESSVSPVWTVAHVSANDIAATLSCDLGIDRLEL
jgi:hypothetical protein